MQGGFRECGLYPLNRSAIPSWKLSPAIPFQQETTPTRDYRVTITETPVRTELRSYFATFIQPKQTEKQKARRRRIKTNNYGEALTNDEAFERLQEQDRQKSTRKKKATKKQPSAKKTTIPKDEEHCQICGDEFEDGEEGDCIGCDECWRWVHYYCAGFESIPESETPWACDQCEADA